MAGERPHSHSLAPPDPSSIGAAAGAGAGLEWSEWSASNSSVGEASKRDSRRSGTPAPTSAGSASKPKMVKAEVLRVAWGVMSSGRTLTKHQKGWDDGLVLLGFVCHVNFSLHCIRLGWKTVVLCHK